MASRGKNAVRPVRIGIPDAVGLQEDSTTLTEGAFGQDGPQEEPFLHEEDAQSAIGVSMSHVHTRLMSPKTPAAEKAAAMEELDGGGLFDGAADSQCQEEEARTQNDRQIESPVDEGIGGPLMSRRHSNESLLRLPSPWTAGPRLFETSGMDGHGRPISKGLMTGPTTMLTDLNVKRFMSSFNFSSLPKTPTLKDVGMPTISSIFGGKDSTPQQKPRQNRAQTVTGSHSRGAGFNMGHVGSNPDVTETSNHVTRVQKHSHSGDEGSAISSTSLPQEDSIPLPIAEDIVRDPPAHQVAVFGYSQNERRLRRTTSDQSLLLRRATSTRSSLGDDTRWEHVQQQVNSRVQAIKDSWQDSNIKLPSMPTLPNIKLNSLRPEFFRPRGRSDPRPALGDTSSTTANVDTVTTNGSADQPQDSGQRDIDDSGAKLPPRSLHPSLDKALEELTGDLLILGGYRGSILRSAKPPHQQLWVPLKVGLNIRKVDLEVGLTSEDEERMHEKIIASGMLSHIGPIDMGRRLLKRLRSCTNVQRGKLRIHDYGYDWRLSPHLLSKRLVDFVANLPCNAPKVPEYERGVTVIAHSLGGLITRHAVNQQPALFAGVVYAGVPQHCVNILGPLRKGDDVLLSSKVLTAQVNFTLRTSYLLLPEEGHCFINKTTKEEYPVDFFDAETWNLHALSPCVAPCHPPYTVPDEKKGILSTVYNNLPSLPSPLKRTSQTPATEPTTASLSQLNSNPSIHCTIPRPLALAYLTRTLADVRAFKSELAYDANHGARNVYPPISVLYSTSVPTVYRAKVACKEAIRHADAYDDLSFASGDGVCLARAAMAPEGYTVCENGKIRVDRGHLGLLGDGEGVGRCLVAILKARRRGVGLGKSTELGDGQ